MNELLSKVFSQSCEFDSIVLNNEIIKSNKELLDKATTISNLIGELYQAVGNLE